MLSKLLLLCGVGALSASSASASEVVALTTSTFDAFIKENKITMVEFYAPWCGHCKTLAPEYDSAAAKLEEFSIKIAKVDATAEADLQAKFKVEGFPTMKIFVDGKDKEYEGERNADGIVNALRVEADPSFKPPAPEAGAGWTDSGAVLHGAEDTWQDMRKEHAKALVMFYAPWCGHCKALKPTWTLVADALAKDEEKVQFMGVDCTATGELCKQYGVSSYPTLVYFDGADDKKGTPYEGGRSKKDLTKFAKQKFDPDWKVVLGEFTFPQVWEEESFGNGNVVHLDDDYFDDFRNTKTKSMVVMFYAPWCGHCKTLKPEWVAASESCGKSMSFAAVDCTTASETCKTVGTEGYPTIRYFEPETTPPGKKGLSTSPEGEEVPGNPRSKDDLTWFANDKKEKFARAQAKAASEAAASGKELTEKDFKKLRVKALKKLLKERGAKCEGCSSKSEFVAMLMKVIKNPVVKKKKGRTLMAEKKYQEAKTATQKGWAEEDFGNGKVVHLLEDEAAHKGFEAYVQEEAHVLAMFYAPWCGHCKALKPDWVKVSDELAKEGSVAKMVAVDCTQSQAVCKKYNAESYPTLVYFKDGHDSKYESGRTAKAIKTFVMKQVDPSYTPVVAPFENSKAWADAAHGNGEVVHLDDDYFASFRTTSAPKMLTMFYAPWCGHCKALKPDFVKASTQAKEAGVVLSVVDCTVSKAVCGEFGVEGYPTLKMFSSATAKPKDYDGSRDEAGLMAAVREMAGESAELKEDEDEAAPPADEDDGIDHDEL